MNFGVFGKSVTIYGIGVALTRVGTFLLIPLYTHSLRVQDYGLLSTLLITLQIMTTVMSFSTPKGMIRFSVEYESKNLLGELIGGMSVITIAGALMILVVCCGPLLPFFRRILHSEEVLSYVALTCLLAFFQVLWIQVVTYYRARNERIKFVSTALATLIILFALNFFFLRTVSLGVKGALAAHILAYGGVGLIIFFRLISKTGLKFSFAVTRKLFMFSLPLLFAISGTLIMDSSAVYFLGYFGSLEQVAIFSLGFKIAQIPATVVFLPFQQAYEPFVYENLENPGIRTAIPKLFTYLMVGYTLVSFFVLLLLRPLLPWIAPQLIVRPMRSSSCYSQGLLSPGFITSENPC